MELGLQGREALVTGASQGIGAAVARALAGEGCHLYVAARSRDRLEALAGELRDRHGVRVRVAAGDLSTAAGIEALACRADGVDIVVNNAGAVPAGRLDEIDGPRWRRAWDLKLFGYIDLCRAFYARMRARGGGVIVNVVGASGERPKSNYICGATANAALIAFTQALGGDSMEHGVRVVGVNPGPVETGRLEALARASAADRLGDAGRWRELFARLPEGRAASVEEVADAVLFVASARSSYVSGAVLTVDGGYCNRGSLM